MTTYGEEWRARARAGEPLDADERRRWLEELEWERLHPDEVAALDRLVGRTVRTVRALELMDGKRLPADTYLTVRTRFRDRVLAETSGMRLLLLREWVRQVRVAPNVKKEPVRRGRTPSVELPPRGALPLGK